MNGETAGFIDKVVSTGIEVGVVTNGSFIQDCIDPLSQCTWVGVSVDAGSSETFSRLKGMKRSDGFGKVIENIAMLTDYSRRHNSRLGLKHPAYGVSYKYLLYKDNIGEVFAAAKLAKEIGCKNIHFRPAGTAWDRIGTPDEIAFTEDEINLFNEQIGQAQELDTDTFGVYGVVHKFNAQFSRSNCFSKCYSVFMTAVISPPSHPLRLKTHTYSDYAATVAGTRNWNSSRIVMMCGASKRHGQPRALAHSRFSGCGNRMPSLHLPAAQSDL